MLRITRPTFHPVHRMLGYSVGVSDVCVSEHTMSIKVSWVTADQYLEHFETQIDVDL